MKSVFIFWIEWVSIIFSLISKSEANLLMINNSENCINFFKKIQITNNFFIFYSIRFTNFINFNEFNISCLNTKENMINEVLFYPDTPLIIDKNLNLNLSFYYRFNTSISLIFIHIQGFDIESSIFQQYLETYTLIFYKSKFSLYQNGLKFNRCSLDNNYIIFRFTWNFIFSKSIKYKKDICPLIFDNLNVEYLEFSGITGTFYKNNQLSFIQINQSLNLKLKSLKLNFYRHKLSEKLIRKNIFRKVENLEIDGNLISIDRNTFYDLRYKTLFLYLNSFVKNLAQDSFWFINLLRCNVDFSLYFPEYDFPLKDFCLFKHYPRNCSMNLNFIWQNNCSCTKIWILQNNSRNFCQNHDTNNCNFPQLIGLCNKSINTKSISNTIDIFYKSELISFINLTLFPFFCILGILTNILIIIIFRNPIIKNELKKEIFKLIYLNSILNFLYCLIYLFHMTSVCITYTGIFCSSIKNSIFVQNYEKYVVEFFGNIIKTLSNIIFVMIALNRYYFLDNNNSNIYLSKRLNNFYLKILIVSLIIILNFYYIFTIKINDHLKFDDIFEYTDYPLKFTFNNIFDYLTNVPQPVFNNFLTKNLIYFLWFLVYSLFNNIVLFVIMTITDISLIFKFKASLKHKKITLGNVNGKIKKINKIEERVTKTICLNSIFLFILRLLEFCVFIYIFLDKINNKNCQKIDKICSNVSQLANLFYLISCSLQIATYFGINQSFRKSLIILIKTLISKK